MSRDRKPRSADWLRLLLWLYPRAHRRGYGAEIVEAARHRRAPGLRGSLRAAWVVASGAPGVWYDHAPRFGSLALRHGWALDVRFVARSLWRSKGYAATATTVLACAVAANATVFSYVKGTLLAEPPYEEPERIAIVWGSNPVDGQLRDVVAGPTFVDLKERVTTLSGVAALHSDGAYLMVDGRPVVMEAHEVSVDFFDILGVAAARGRLFDDRERFTGGAETVVVTHAFWRDRLGAGPDAVGSVLSFEGGPRTVIGVLPQGFEFLSPAPLFVPLAEDVMAARSRRSPHFHVIGRRADGAGYADVNRELQAIMAELTDEYPTYEGWSLLAEPFHEVAVAAVRPAILVLVGTVLLVMLVALVNLTTLFRIRSFARHAELSVRAALGAGRGRIARVLALETLGIATAGAALGLIATPFLLARVSDLIPAWVAIPDSAARVPVLLADLDPTVAVTAFALALVGSAALTATSLRLGNVEIVPTARRSVHAGFRGTRLLVGLQIAVAATLCVGAGLVMKSTGTLLRTDVGVEPDGVLTMYFGDIWGDEPADRIAYFRAVVDEVERIPGVLRAGVMGYVDFQAEDDFAGISFLERTEQPRENALEEWRRVDEGLMGAAGMRTVVGRPFAAEDFQGPARVALVNEAFAAKYFDGDAVDRLISVHDAAYQEIRIVGVVADVRTAGPAAPAPPVLYVPYQGNPRGTQGLYVRVDGDPMAFVDQVQEAIWSVDSSQPIDTVSPLSQWIEMWIAVPRAMRGLITSLALLAWFLSALGVFGVVAYAVRSRRAELGVRLALGASPNRLQSEQLRTIAPVVFAGLVVGLALGVSAARLGRAVLYGVAPADPIAIVVTVLAVGGAAVLATAIPARSALRDSPAEILRSD